MLKIILRVVIILLVAGALGGGLLLLVNNGAGQTALASAAGGRLQFGSGFNTNLAAQGAPTGFHQDFGGRDGAGGGLASVWKNLGLIALITAGVVVLQRLVRLALHRRPVPAS